jgi:uncharacterized protein YgbK (DUF1537 family)
MTLLLGAIADDFTGATDLANTLVQNGMRTIQVIGVPTGRPVPDEVEGIVVALKSRTSAPEAAVAESLASLDWLRAAGARQFFFKYCSTFDSTPQGNIGPVAEALMEALGTDFTVACPAFPRNGRSIYNGYLFVGAKLLSESGMRTHPLTPMTDSSLIRLLAAQARRRVGLIGLAAVREGNAAVRAEMARLRKEGHGFAITDAVDDDDLLVLGRAFAELPLLTGGSGLAMGLPQNFRDAGLLAPSSGPPSITARDGRRLVIAGSCSPATLAQVAEMSAVAPAFRVDFDLVVSGNATAAATAWAARQPDDGPILIYSSAPPEEIAATQARFGAAASGAAIEAALAAITRELVETGGVRGLIVAGGETSGAVVNALGISSLRIGPEICPGVPWTECETAAGVALVLALKSGNFGPPSFFSQAWDSLR